MEIRKQVRAHINVKLAGPQMVIQITYALNVPQVAKHVQMKASQGINLDAKYVQHHIHIIMLKLNPV